MEGALIARHWRCCTGIGDSKTVFVPYLYALKVTTRRSVDGVSRKDVGFFSLGGHFISDAVKQRRHQMIRMVGTFRSGFGARTELLIRTRNEVGFSSIPGRKIFRNPIRRLHIFCGITDVTCHGTISIAQIGPSLAPREVDAREYFYSAPTHQLRIGYLSLPVVNRSRNAIHRNNAQTF